jgi:hypothetical protein
MPCPSCGEPLPPWSRFCSWCGEASPPQAWSDQGGDATIPEWRQDGAGWVLLHVAVGLLGLWSVQLVLIGLVLAVAGRGRALLPIDLVPAATGLLGWFLFVYLRRGPAIRWAALLIPIVLGFGLTYAVNVRLQPAA